jgi:hypothetical protein
MAHETDMQADAADLQARPTFKPIAGAGRLRL